MMESSREDHESLIESFVGVTSASRDEAIFFLESHNWSLESSVHSFFDSSDLNNPSSPSSTAIASPASRRPPPAAAAAVTVPEEEEEDEDERDEDYVPSPPPDRHRSPPSPVKRVSVRSKEMSSSSGSKKPSKPSGSGSGRPTIRTLADLNKLPAPSSDDDSDEPQEYYTGGEKSGMLVQDPRRDSSNDVDAIFDRARQMGAMQGPFEPNRSSSSRSFTGTGRTLSGDTVQSAPQQSENIVHNIYFWSNGFTVNDGPLRSFDDPENAPFLESIMKSECPKELAPADRTPVHVNLIKREEKYSEPVKRQAAFQGVGRTLGVSSSSGSQAPASSEPVTAPTPSAGLFVDAALPSTPIQLRLADGTRMVARFNYHHTVADVREFINASRPGVAQTYQLQTVGFPPKQLTDLSQTIEQAGLANSVVIQKL